MTITPLMAFRELAKQGEIRLIEQTGKHWSREVSAANIASLTRLARQADVVLYFGGEESILSGEARCRAHLNLPGDQSAQLRALKATGKPVVLTVMLDGKISRIQKTREKKKKTGTTGQGGALMDSAVHKSAGFSDCAAWRKPKGYTCIR